MRTQMVIHYHALFPDRHIRYSAPRPRSSLWLWCRFLLSSRHLQLLYSIQLWIFWPTNCMFRNLSLLCQSRHTWWVASTPHYINHFLTWYSWHKQLHQHSSPASQIKVVDVSAFWYVSVFTYVQTLVLPYRPTTLLYSSFDAYKQLEALPP